MHWCRSQAAEELAKRRRKGSTFDMRRAQCERTRLLAPWRSAHVPVEARVPMPFLRFMLEHGMLVKGHGLLHQGHGKVAVHDGDGAPLIDTRPWLLCFNAAGPGSDMARLRSAIGEKRIDDAVTKADAFLNQDGTASVSTRGCHPMAVATTAWRSSRGCRNSGGTRRTPRRRYAPLEHRGFLVTT